MSWPGPRAARDADPADPNDPGWWQASDGRWYPPESAWTTPPLPPRARQGISPSLIVFLGILAASLLVVATFAIRARFDTHPSALGTRTSAKPPTRRTAVVPPSLPVAPPSLAVVVDPTPGAKSPLGVSEATVVATRLWNDHVQARFRNDVPLLRAVETGPALEADIGFMCYLGCHGPDAVATEVLVNVPRQTTWPVSFAANVEYTNVCDPARLPCVDTFVMTQAARGRPWKIIFWTTASGGGARPELQAALAPDGSYAATPGTPRISAHTLLAEYASYLDAFKRTGRPPTSTDLAPGGFTTVLGPELYDPPQHQRDNGYSEQVDYLVDPADPTFTFATSENTMLVCGTVRYVARDSGVDGRPVVQPSDFSAFGGDVLPGRYSLVVTDGLHMVCFGLHAAVQPVYVIASYGEDTKVTTVGAR